MISKVLLTGGRGLLGTELQKYLPFSVYAPTVEGLDITKPDDLVGDYETVIHCAAYTDVAKAEEEKELCYKTNVIGVYNLLMAYQSARFIYISTEYVYNPVNFYSYTKLWGENMVKWFSKDYLIIRTLFKPNPYPHNIAFIDQHTRGDHVDIIAPMIVTEILKGTKGIIDIGTGRKTIFELARRTRPDVLGNSVDDIKGVKIPKDYR